MSLQYLKKEVSYEKYFFHAHQQKGLLQIDTVILTGMIKHS